MPEDFYFDWNHKVREVYRQVVGESDPEDGVKLADARAGAASRLRELIEAGELTIPVDFAITAALAQADKSDGKVVDKIIARMMRGEDAFDIEDDPALDCVVIVEARVRKPLRHIKSHDLLAMDALRYRNMRAATVAYDEWRETYERALAAVIKYGSFGEAVESGEFENGAA